MGWRLATPAPEARHYVLVVAPHTSNWDFPIFLLSAWAFGLNVRWLAKHSLFVPVVGPILESLGGIPVDRRAPQGLVDRLARLIHDHDSLALTVSAEGTRGYRSYWKSGFLSIARTSGVPVCMGYIDWPSRTTGISPAFWPSDDPSCDMERVRAFYAGKRGFYPDQMGRIRLRSESDD